jgi:hypothetical protein
VAISTPSADIVTRSVPKRTPRGIRPAPKPTPMVSGRVARRLAEAQGHAFADIAADLDAADAHDTADQIDARRDTHIRCALRLVRLARRDPSSADAYLALADGHLVEAIRADQIHDEHRKRERVGIADSIGAGQALNGVIESMLCQTGADDDAPLELTLGWPYDGAEPEMCGRQREPMGAITFESCSQPLGHDQDGSVHVFLARGTEQETAP